MSKNNLPLQKNNALFCFCGQVHHNKFLS